MKFAYFNPTVVAVDEVPSDMFMTFKNMVNVAHTKSELNDEGDPTISIRGGQQIQLLPNEFDLDIGPLKGYIEYRCREYMDAITKQSGRADLSNYEPVLVSAWTIKQDSGCYQALHTHDAHISGNMYIEVPDIDAETNISDAHIEFRLPVIKDPSKFIFVDHWRFSPKQSTMIIFPSYLPHAVYPWNTSGTRTILAWDVRIVPKKPLTEE